MTVQLRCEAVEEILHHDCKALWEFSQQQVETLSDENTSPRDLVSSLTENVTRLHIEKKTDCHWSPGHGSLCVCLSHSSLWWLYTSKCCTAHIKAGTSSLTNEQYKWYMINVPRKQNIRMIEWTTPSSPVYKETAPASTCSWKASPHEEQKKSLPQG